MDRFPRTAAIVVLALLLSAATLMAGCTQQQPLTVKITENPTYGKILTDSTGRSLYIQARDVPNTGAVANLGEVGRFYPPFYAESVTDGDGINISEFGHISRADGKQQTTFRGWPLYYYINDKASGEAKSQGANNITFLAKPDYTVMVRENVTLGIYLSDPSGAPLLVRDNDTSEGPAPDYLPFRVSTVVAPSPLVQSADFGEVTGPSGGSQTTFRGQPLYLFSGQDRPGTIAGDCQRIPRRPHRAGWGAHRQPRGPDRRPEPLGDHHCSRHRRDSGPGHDHRGDDRDNPVRGRRVHRRRVYADAVPDGGGDRPGHGEPDDDLERDHHPDWRSHPSADRLRTIHHPPARDDGGEPDHPGDHGRGRRRPPRSKRRRPVRPRFASRP